MKKRYVKDILQNLEDISIDMSDVNERLKDLVNVGSYIGDVLKNRLCEPATLTTFTDETEEAVDEDNHCKCGCCDHDHETGDGEPVEIEDDMLAHFNAMHSWAHGFTNFIIEENVATYVGGRSEDLPAIRKNEKRVKKAIKTTYFIYKNTTDPMFVCDYHDIYWLYSNIADFVSSKFANEVATALLSYYKTLDGSKSGKKVLKAILGIHSKMLKNALNAVWFNYAAVLQLNVSQIQIDCLTSQDVEVIPEVIILLKSVENAYRIFNLMLKDTFDTMDEHEMLDATKEHPAAFQKVFSETVHELLTHFFRYAARCEQKIYINRPCTSGQIKDIVRIIDSHISYVYSAYDMAEDLKGLQLPDDEDDDIECGDDITMFDDLFDESVDPFDESDDNDTDDDDADTSDNTGDNDDADEASDDSDTDVSKDDTTDVKI